MKSDNPRVHLVRTYYPHWGAHTAFNALVPRLRASGLPLHDRRVPMDSGKWPLSILERTVSRVSRKRGIREYRLRDMAADMRSLFSIRFGKLDLIHLLDGEHSLLALPRWLRKLSETRRPVLIATLHQPPSLLPGLVRPEHLKELDLVLTVSPEQTDFLLDWVPGQPVRTLLLGVDTKHFTPPESPPPEQPFICLAGGIWMRDYDALNATADLLSGQDNLEFHLVSPPPDYRPRTGNIIIHRNISDQALLHLYRSSHLLFMPLREATANTFLMEGAACGLPVLSTDRPSVRAYFPGPEAVLVQENNPQSFAATIRLLIHQPGTRRDMSRAARRRAEELSWETMAEEYLAMYRELVASSRDHAD